MENCCGNELWNMFIWSSTLHLCCCRFLDCPHRQLFLLMVLLLFVIMLSPPPSYPFFRFFFYSQTPTFSLFSQPLTPAQGGMRWCAFAQFSFALFSGLCVTWPLQPHFFLLAFIRHCLFFPSSIVYQLEEVRVCS